MKKSLGIGTLLVVVAAVTTFLDPMFATAYNIENILRWTSLYGILSIGAALVIITGGIDLSIGSVVGLVGSLLPWLLTRKGWSPAPALLVVMATCLAIGLGHGLLIARLRLQPFVVTLCGLLFYRGFARWLTADAAQGFGSGYGGLKYLAAGKPFSVPLPFFAEPVGIPMPFLILLALAVLAAVFLNLTIWGRYMLALGRNERAARMSGVPTGRMVVSAYVLSALLSGIGGVLFALDLNAVQPSGHGSFYELYAIAAAVLGGCSLRGGEGSILGVILGAAVIRVLYNAINILAIPTQLEFAIIGAVILLGVTADELVKRLAAARRTARESRGAGAARARGPAPLGISAPLHEGPPRAEPVATVVVPGTGGSGCRLAVSRRGNVDGMDHRKCSHEPPRSLTWGVRGTGDRHHGSVFMNQTCPECGAEIDFASLFGAIPSKLDCAKCGTSLVFDKQEAEYRRAPSSGAAEPPAGATPSRAPGGPAAPEKSVPPAATRSTPSSPSKHTPPAMSNSTPTIKSKGSGAPVPAAGSSTPSLGKTRMEPKDLLRPSPMITGRDSPADSQAEIPAVEVELAHEATAVSPRPHGSGPEVSLSSPAPGSLAGQEPKDSLTGRTIGGCEIEKWLGRGGMGSVYLGRQLSLDRPVAFKVISESAQRDESFLRRFEREAKTIARFNSSRIVQIYEVGFDQGIHFILMEYVSGGDLKKKTADLGRVSPEQAAAYTRQAAEGLLAAERQKIVHRDLKPENLMLDANGEIKITDFGLAKMLQTENITLTQMGDYLGTPIYMSPEQAQGVTLDHRSDMYSLGATLYFLLTGVHPYTGGSVYEILKKKTEYEFLDPTTSNLEQPIPEGLCNIMRRMTALQPKDRYPSFEDLIEDLDRWERGQPTQTYKPKRKRSPVKLAAMIGVPVLLLAGGILYMKNDQKPAVVTPGPGVATPAEDCGRLQEQLNALSTRGESEGASLALVAEMQALSGKAASSCTSLLRDANNLVDATLLKLIDGQEVKIREKQKGLKSDASILALKGVLDTRTETKLFPTSIAKDMQARLAGLMQDLDVSIKEGLVNLVASQRSELEKHKATLKKDGPSNTLTEAISKLQSAVKTDTRQLILEVTDLAPQAQGELNTLQAAIADLSRENSEGVRIIDRLDRLPPPPPLRVPFSEVPGYLESLRVAMKPPQVMGDELNGWLDVEKNRRLAEIRGNAELALKDSLQSAEAEKEKYSKGEVASQDNLLAMATAVVAGKKVLNESFPADKDRWEAAAPEARIKDLSAVMDMRQGDQKRLLEISAAIDATDKMFPEPAKAAEWNPQLKEKIQGEIQKSRTDLKTLETKPALKAELGRLEKRLVGQEQKSAVLDQGAKGLVDATASFDAHRLKELAGFIETLKKALPEDPRVEKLSAAKKSMDEGFTALTRDLNLSKAHDSFEAARVACTEVGLPGTYPAQCLERLKKLQDLIDQKMSAVRGGSVRVQGASADAAVKGYFIDNTEVTIESFLKFQDVLKKRSFQDVKSIWPSAELFQQDLNKPAYLTRSADHNIYAPIEEASYYLAVAYLKESGKSLFSLEEWWLAARGPVGKAPVGLPPEPRNARFPKQANQEGQAYNLEGVFHLAGNVAEWTSTKKGNSYCLVGSRYSDSATSSLLLFLPPEDKKAGCGFRGIIRPEAFFSDLLEPLGGGAPAGSGSGK